MTVVRLGIYDLRLLNPIPMHFDATEWPVFLQWQQSVAIIIIVIQYACGCSLVSDIHYYAIIGCNSF